jgi:hypothetical protein
VVVLVVFRQRLFVRDPLAKVERNGLQQTEYRVYLNYFNDILVEDLAQNRRYLVQAKNGVPMVPGVPVHLGCVRGLGCLTEADYAATEPLGGKGYAPDVEMTSAYVTFVDGDGTSMRVSLR